MSKAVGIVDEYCDIVLTGDASADARYNTIDRYFRKVCGYLEQGLENKDDDAIDFYNM